MLTSLPRTVLALLVVSSAMVASAGDDNNQGYVKLAAAGSPMLGIEMSPTTISVQGTEGLGPDQGVLVRQVFPNTAAQAMGVQPGDVVLAVNHAAITSMSDLRNEVGYNNVGDPVEIEVSRNGQRIPMRGEFQEWPSSIPREPLDPAVEQRFKDWQRRHLERNQNDVAQLRQALDDLKNQQAHPELANAAQPDQALDEMSGFLKALPAWRVDLRYGLDQRDIAANDDAPVAAISSTPAADPAQQPWRIVYRLDSTHPKPE